jgi:hypothetical protein
MKRINAYKVRGSLYLLPAISVHWYTGEFVIIIALFNWSIEIDLGENIDDYYNYHD